MASTAPKQVRTMDDSFAELLDSDTNAAHVHAAMRTDSPIDPGPALVPTARYISREYHELEKENLWSRVWQVAAHEDDFPTVGDVVPTARYISREYHELEKENLWSRVWQVAAHEDDFPSIGDVVPYDIVDKSYLVVRVGENDYKAYYNACLHRGRKLREVRGKALTELRCAFHGWAWNLDGTISQVPCAYDFAELNREEESLPEVKVGRWGRFIFINPDPDCESLESYLGNLSSEFETLPYERRYKQAHVAKVIKANWKVTQEAFMESYHVYMTHPQGLTHGVHDGDTKYDVFGNYSRAILCGALDGEGMPEWEILEPEDGVVRLRHPLNGWVYESTGDGTVQVTTPKGESGKFDADANWLEGDMLDANMHICIIVGGPKVYSPELDRSAPISDPKTVKEVTARLGNNASPRAIRGEIQRETLRASIPSLADTIPDIELSAAIYLTVFPNFHPWGSFNPINYRFRPNGDNHEECMMEVMFLAPIPEDGQYTPASEIHWLSEDEDWTDAPELGVMSPVFNQDVRNMRHVHEGMKSLGRGTVRYADYNETKIRHFHDLYGQWVDEA